MPGHLDKGKLSPHLIMASSDRDLNKIIDKALGHDRDDPPNYAGDLNAVQDAIMSLAQERGTALLVSVESDLSHFMCHHDHIETDKVFARPRQRAEAIVMTMERTK